MAYLNLEIQEQNATLTRGWGKPTTRAMNHAAARVYLDNAATTPLRPEARAAMLAALEDFGNPSSVHAEGQRARALLDDARRSMGDALGVRAEPVVVTSGG